MKLLIAAIVLVLAATAVAPAAGAGEPDEVAPLRVVLKIADPATRGLDAVLGIHDESVQAVEPLLASRGIYRIESTFEVEIKDGKAKLHGDAKKWFEKLEKDDLVVWAEVDLSHVLDDDGFHAWPQSSQGDAVAADLAGQRAFERLRLDAVHQVATGEGLRVAVLDTGVDQFHPMLIDHLAPGYDLIDDDTNPAEAWNGTDDDGDGKIDEAYGHGTFVAGVIAQVAPGAQIIPLRVLDDDGQADEWAVIEAIEIAIEMDVDVINMSFGLTTDHKSKRLEDAVKRASKAGIVVVAAAGNLNEDEKRFPAAHKNVLSVGALDRHGRHLARFSNHGKWVSLAAPGVDLVSSVPGGGYASWGGTSVSTPVVAGLGLIAQEYAPDAKAKDITKALLEGARKMEGDRRAEAGVVDMFATFDRLD